MMKRSKEDVLHTVVNTAVIVAIIVVVVLTVYCVIVYGIMGKGRQEGPTPIPTSTPVPTEMVIPEPTITMPEEIPTPEVTVSEEMPAPDQTVTVVPEPTAEPAPELTDTPVPTSAPEATSTPVPTAIPEPTSTPVPTSTPEPTSTPVPTSTPTPSPTPTATPTPTPSPKPTATPTPTPSPKPTVTPKPTSTPVPMYVPEEHGYTEKVNEWQCGDHIVAELWWNGMEQYKGMECVLVFEGTGAMWEDKRMQETYGDGLPWVTYAYDYTDNVCEVYFSEGITYISDIASIAMRLTKVVLPSTVKEIGEYAFYGANQVEELNLPEGLEVIGERAFYGWTALREINLPSTLQRIEWVAFAFSSVNRPENPIAAITIPERVEFIDYGAFYMREDLIIYVEGNTEGFAEGWNYYFDGVEHEVIYK